MWSDDEKTLDETNSEPTLILVARVITGSDYIVCAAGDSLSVICEELDAAAVEDLDFLEEVPEGNGLWVWEGNVGSDENMDEDDEDDHGTVAEGAWRRPNRSEIEALAAGRDPWPDGPGTWWAAGEDND